ncbi:uridine diphosphate-N-acetylglucosamine-binding protein YvcK [Geothrix sp. 21YS21S-4]|uniref:gluconeogenesis factor YvcK family protein n=1 Tax=Geothrix sp. 21YS21S-4 TaxID=3068889 RepID=UPI0027BAF484|nr:uridine diphosphate-N-acetylglucosamine-binding protein YvcK [Geothrix sp. 21YS21S-4]
MAPSLPGPLGLHADQPLRVVALGGGTGLAALLRALKREAGRSRDPWKLTGIVTVSDNGGSSGRLRDELGGIPPGDLRNCLSALTMEDSALSELLNYRFKGDGSLSGHSLGNLMLWALADLSGDWVRAIRQLSSVLVTVGRLFPSTVVPVTLCAEDMAGALYVGETAVGSCRPPLARLWLEPPGAEPLPEAVLALLRADLVLLSPGSLYSSTISNLLLPELQEAVAISGAPVVYVANLMTEPGETSGLDLETHVAAISAFGRVRMSAVIANSTPLRPDMLARYREEGGEPLLARSERVLDIPIHCFPLLDPEAPMARHHPDLLNQAIRETLSRL